MIALEHLMIKKKLLNKLKKARDKNDISIFTDYIIQAKVEIKEILDSQISQIIYDSLKDIKLTDDLYSAILYIDNNSILVQREMALRFYNSGNINSFINLIKNNKLLLTLDCVNQAFNNIINNSGSDRSVEILAETGIYKETHFENYFRANHSDEEIKRIALIFKANGNISDFENLINSCIEKNHRPVCYSILADLYCELGEKEKLSELLDLIVKNNIDHSHIDMEHYYSYLGNYRKVVEFADAGAMDDAVLADAYYHLGCYERSLKIYKYIYYNINKNVINMVIENSYVMKDYYSVLNYTTLLGKTGSLDQKNLLYKIESEILLDLYNDLESDFKEYKSKYGNDDKILKLLIKYYRAVDNPEMSYKIALNLIDMGNADPENYRIIIDYLYINEEYSELLSYTAKYNLVQAFKPEYCSSLIYSGKIDEAIGFISGDENLLDSGMVIDAIFSVARNNENIKKFNSINKPETLLDLIILYMHGKKIDYAKYINKVKNGKSIAGTYILAVAGNHAPFNNNYIKKLISPIQYISLSSLNDNILSINNGEDIEGLMDSKYFLYPLTRELIKNKRYKEAMKILDSTQTHGPDAFYYYCKSYIEFKNSEIPDAIKHVEAAMSILDNCDFIALRIKIGLLKNESISDYIKLTFDMGFIEVFSNLDLFLERNQVTPNIEFINIIEKLEIANLSIYRLKNYCIVDYKQKLKYSALALFYGGESRDVVRHYSILKLKDERNAIKFLESYKKKYYAGYMILAEYYYSKRIIKKAIEYFNLAYIRNNRAAKSQLFKDLFSGDPVSDAVLNAMVSTGEWFHLLLYYYHRRDYANVLSIAKNHYRNKKIIEFLIGHAWETMPLRSFMIGLFMDSHDRILGELLSSKLDDMELYSDEIKILMELLKDYPEENRLYCRLISSMVNNGNTDEALETSYKYFYEKKNITSFNIMVQTSYNLRDYNSTANLFKNNSEFVTADNIKYWIYAQIKLFNYTAVQVIMHDYGNLLSNLRTSIDSRLESSYRTKMVISIAKKILNNEYDKNKISDMDEIRENAPEYIANDVYEFITGSEPYSYIPPYEYNKESINIIERIAHLGISDINDIRMYHIYKATGDVIKSKNFYIFIKRSIEGYYKIEELSKIPINNDNSILPSGIIGIMLKYRIGIIDAVYIAGKIKKGTLN
jgi:hypothetical protein